MSELANLFKDLRGDMKQLIKTLGELSIHLSKLESFEKSIEKLTRVLEEANRNIELLNQIIREVK